MNKKINVDLIVKNALCTGCGACCGICSFDAITMKFNLSGYLHAHVSIDKCTLCGLCINVCPSWSSNLLFKEGYDPFHGNCINAYIGCSTDPTIRHKSQSGGIVTSLLCFLLDNGLIEGAIVNNFNEKTKCSDAIFATRKEQIVDAAGSYYTQSPVVKTVLQNVGQSVATVVLGCQAQSLNLIKRKCPNVELPAYKIGLICAGHYSKNYIDDLVSISGANLLKVKRFRFRDKKIGGWPGGVNICTSEGEYVLNKKYRHMLKPLYETARCCLCFDQMNIHSDLVVGDPWGVDNHNNKTGNSVFITRTQNGQYLIDEAIRQGYIEASLIDSDKVILGQTVDSRQKTQFFTANRYWDRMGWLLPVNENEFDGLSFIPPTPKERRKIINRLRYTRRIFLETNAKSLCKTVSFKRKQLIFCYWVLWMFKLPKRVLKYLSRILISRP